MKLYRNAIILLVIVGLLAGAYFYLQKRESSDAQDDSDTIKIFDLDSDKIVEITLENKDGKFVFVRETVKEGDSEVKKWKIVTPADLKINESAVNSIAINFANLTASKVIEENATDLAKYGLDRPTVVTVRMEDGTVKALEVGSETPTKNGYYAKVKDSNTVYAINSYEGKKLSVDKNGLRDKSLLDVNTEDIIGFSLDRAGSNVFTAKKDSNDDWYMVSPMEGEVDAAAINTMLNGVTQASIAEFVEENPSDLSKYGLVNPAYVLEVETSSEKHRILIGKEEKKDNTAYAMREGVNEVFTLYTSSLNFLDKPLKEIVDVFAYIANINDVNKIVVEMDGYTVNCELQTDKEDSDNDKFFVNGKDVTDLRDEKGSQLFRKYYQALIGITLSEVEPNATPSGTPEITFTYYLKKDPGIMKVEFIPRDDRYYYVMRNGKYTGMLVLKKKFDEPEGVREMYKKLTEAMKK